MARRLVVTVFAFVIAAACGAIFLAVAALLDPGTREAGFDAALAGLFAIIDESVLDGRPEGAFAAFVFVMQAIVVAVCVAPLAVAALIGELAGVRAWVWYAGASALLAAASPWIARAARGLDRVDRVSPLEGRIALLFFLTGTVAGTVYWLIAGRNGPAGRGGPPATV